MLKFRAALEVNLLSCLTELNSHLSLLNVWVVKISACSNLFVIVRFECTLSLVGNYKYVLMYESCIRSI